MSSFYAIPEDDWNALEDVNGMLQTLSYLACAVSPKGQITLPAEALTSTLSIMEQQLQRVRQHGQFHVN